MLKVIEVLLTFACCIAGVFEIVISFWAVKNKTLESYCKMLFWGLVIMLAIEIGLLTVALLSGNSYGLQLCMVCAFVALVVVSAFNLRSYK